MSIRERVGSYLDTEEEYWYICLFNSLKDAEKLFNWYKERGKPVLLFSVWGVGRAFLVAAFGTDAEHIQASYETRVQTEESYAGLLRVEECFMYHTLIDSANIQ